MSDSSNGRLAIAGLVKISGFKPYTSDVNVGIGSDRLAPIVAHQYEVMAADYAAEFGGEILEAAEGYRPYERQETAYEIFLRDRFPTAALPGTSPHGLARAVDLRGPAATPGTPQHAWIVANAGKYGFALNVAREPWHLAFVLIPSITTASSAYQEVDMPLTEKEWERLSDLIDTRTNKQIENQLKGDGLQKAVTRVLPAALQAALDVVTVPYATIAGKAKTSLSDLGKDVRNALYPAKK